MAEEEVVAAVSPVPSDKKLMAEEEVLAAESPVPLDHKRKFEDLEPEAPEKTVSGTPPDEILADLNVSLNPDSNSNEGENDVQKSQESAEQVSDSPEMKRARIEEEADGSAAENGHQEQQLDEPPTENSLQPTVEDPHTENSLQPTAEDPQTEIAQDSSVDNLPTENHENYSMGNHQTEDAPPSSDENLQTDVQYPSEGDLQQPPTGIPQQGDLSFTQQQPTTETQSMSRKMEVPNNKVGVLIGKAGDTIRFLQFNSGAKIQITRDADADPYSTTRPVELIGTLENINKAEKLIKDVIAEAEAGGSPALVARGFGTAQAGGAAEQIHIQVPNEKVGLIIGRGGETIKNLQTKSGARIQLIPQHLPEGDQSKERTVRVTGNKKQIEMASEMIKEVMNQPVRPSPHSGAYNQQTFRPRGPIGQPQWGPRGQSPAQPMGYDYQQRGIYPSQNPQYAPPTYGGYPPQQSAPRGSFNAGWDQRPLAPVQVPQSGGYDYYGQAGGHATDASLPAPVSTAPAPASAVGPTAQVNYNYGHPQGPDYGQPATYPQSVPPQQNYGHGYEDPKYENQPPVQHAYGGQGASQPGVYPQQVSSQPGYAQQTYSKPPYGTPSQGAPPQSYGPPRTNQPGDVPYQGPMSSTHSYGPSGPQQQSYPYASSGPAQQTYPYGAAPTSNDGYNQQPSVAASAPSYPQQGGQAFSGYGQAGGQPGTGYPQGGPTGGYGPYSSSQPQPGYNEHPAPSNVNYGYQGPTDAGYGNAPGYGAPASQVGYAQPNPNQPSYDQSMPQPGGYGGVPGNAPVGYGKSLSPQPQPGYGQYDATQMYGGHH